MDNRLGPFPAVAPCPLAPYGLSGRNATLMPVLAPMLVMVVFRNLKEIDNSGTTILLVEQNAKQTLKIDGPLLPDAHEEKLAWWMQVSAIVPEV